MEINPSQIQGAIPPATTGLQEREPEKNPSPRPQEREPVKNPSHRQQEQEPAKNLRQEAENSFLNIISLNTMKLRNLAGLHALVRESNPDIIFLQEVNLTKPEVEEIAQGLGYTAHRSERQSPKRVIYTLSKQPAVVSEVKPGFLQRIKTQNLEFLRSHLG